MNQSEKKTRPTKNTRTKIIDVTKALLMEGQANPSMRLIAEKSGVTKSAIYYFFADKNDLFSAVMQTVPVELARKTEELAQKNLSPDRKLLEIMEAYLFFMRKEQVVSQLLFRQIFSQDEELLKKVFEERKKSLSVIFSIIQEGMDKGIFRKADPEKITGLLAGILDFFGMALMLPCPQGEEKCGCNPEELCKEFLQLLKPA